MALHHIPTTRQSTAPLLWHYACYIYGYYKNETVDESYATRRWQTIPIQEVALSLVARQVLSITVYGLIEALSIRVRCAQER